MDEGNDGGTIFMRERKVLADTLTLQRSSQC